MATEVPGLTITVGTPLEEQLDPGIADVVIMLRNLGFNTGDSGDGRSKPDDERVFDVKHVSCTLDPMNDDPALAGTARFFEEADRLQKVLGSGWTVEASYAPKDETFILLATKNEAPGPRHQAAIDRWAGQIAGPFDTHGRYGPFVDAGNELLEALKHELGRR